MKRRPVRELLGRVDQLALAVKVLRPEPVRVVITPVAVAHREALVKIVALVALADVVPVAAIMTELRRRLERLAVGVPLPGERETCQLKIPLRGK